VVRHKNNEVAKGDLSGVVRELVKVAEGEVRFEMRAVDRTSGPIERETERTGTLGAEAFGRPGLARSRRVS
jgi:hypothetical protein